MIGPMPDDLGATSRLLTEIGATIQAVPTLTEVQEWRRLHDLVTEIRPRVGGEIEAAAHTHLLPGGCDRCPWG